MGVLGWFCGGVWLLELLLSAIASPGQGQDLRSALAGEAMDLLIAAGIFAGGFNLFGVGVLFLCVRDFVQNTFWLRRL